MELNNSNYFSQEAQREFFSVSQFKAFKECEERGLAEATGKYVRPETKDLLMGSYVDAWFSNEMETFTETHPEIFNTRTGALKADYTRCDELIERAERDAMFHEFMNGKHQVVMTGELFGEKWKIKVDSMHEDKIVDLKLMKDIEPIYKDGERKTFIDAWGYDIQGFVYQQIVKANIGKELPFYLAVITKEKSPNLEIIHIPQWRLNSAGELIKHYTPRFAKVKRQEAAPTRCEKCDWCRGTKVLTRAMEYEELVDAL